MIPFARKETVDVLLVRCTVSTRPGHAGEATEGSNNPGGGFCVSERDGAAIIDPTTEAYSRVCRNAANAINRLMRHVGTADEPHTVNKLGLYCGTIESSFHRGRAGRESEG
ncbi:unnamed protein product [Colias eurytheme]|nr:unnamed protein product [Colias eurytheme]